MATAALELLIQLKDDASAGLSAITGSLGGVGKAALTVAGGALVGLGGGFAAAAVSGFSLNNAMEQTTAKINAFTKDGAATAQILEMIQDRASKTPFEFQAMADAAAALIPSAKQSGVALEDLIAQAEILAASNPAEGLEGAAYALKEAVSGDFTSAIERFNLPRQYLNELKAQGVPAAEAVSMAMQQLGLDADLVSNLAETASGRWSTFKDTLQGLAAKITQPIFTMFSKGLGDVNTLLTANTPLLEATATAIGEGLAGAINSIVGGITWLVGEVSALAPVFTQVARAAQELLALFTGYQADIFDTTDNLRELAFSLGFTSEQVNMVDSAIHQAGSVFRELIVNLSTAATAIGTFLVNWYYKYKDDKRQEKSSG